MLFLFLFIGLSFVGIKPSVGQGGSKSNLNSQNIPTLDSLYSSDLLGIGGPFVSFEGNSAISTNSSFVFSLEIPVSDEISTYIVQPGDTISEIAQMHKVSVNTIIWANDLNRNGNLIKPGDELVILPITGIRYKIGQGDTLQKIANKYEGDIFEITKFNGLAVNDTLKIGQEVIVPNGRIPQLSAPAQARTVASQSQPQRQVSSGYYIRPISGGVRSQGLHGFNAVDLAVSSGSPIYASADGVVSVSRYNCSAISFGCNGGYGNYIVINHPNSTQTLYAHNQSNVVSAGQRVSQGEVIGYVGSTGRSTGPHVHFEVRGAPNPF